MKKLILLPLGLALVAHADTARIQAELERCNDNMACMIAAYEGASNKEIKALFARMERESGADAALAGATFDACMAGANGTRSGCYLTAVIGAMMNESQRGVDKP